MVKDPKKYGVDEVVAEKMGLSWGGARPGAGRPRSESLDAEELTFLAWLVNESAYSAEYADLVDKMLRIADRVKVKGR